MIDHRIHSRIRTLALLIGALALATACSTRPPATKLTTAPEPQTQRRSLGIDCRQPVTPLDQQVCSAPGLIALEASVNAAFLERLRTEPKTGRAVLLGFHSHWLKQRGSRCVVSGDLGDGLGEGLAADMQQCLEKEYHAQVAALAARPAVGAPSVQAERLAERPHPLANYVHFRVREDNEPALCGTLAETFNQSIARDGVALPRNSSELLRVAGSPESPRVTYQGREIAVVFDDAGAYGGFELRPRSLAIDGKPVIDTGSVARWVGRLPNSGGRFNTSASSQTGDFAALEVFQRGSQLLALVVEPWGYYSPAARGESAYAAVFEVTGASPRPLCLYQTYLTPPVANVLAALPDTRQLNELLEQMSGGPSAQLAPHERVDLKQLHQEALWQLLNMPALGLDEATRGARLPALQQLHDAMLDAMFRWSERDQASKSLYRQLLPRFQPAQLELKNTFTSTHGLSEADANLAADLVLMELTAYAAENLDHEAGTHVARGVGKAVRYKAAPAPGDLEKGRKFASVHSVILNRAPPAVIDDFIRHEFTGGSGLRGRAPSGEPALATAVADLDTVRKLLAAGADANDTNAWGRTALHLAVTEGHIDSARVLVGAGARADLATLAWLSAGAGGPDIDASAISGRTALMEAAARGSAEMIRLLLEASPATDQRDSRFRSACSEMDGNAALTPEQQLELKPRLCRPAPKTALKNFKELLAAGAQPIPGAEVSTMTVGTRHTGEQRGSHYEIRFGTNGRLEGTLRPAAGGQLPLAGRWSVEPDGKFCVATTLVIEGLGRRTPLPTRCSRFYQVAGATYSAPANAVDGDPVEQFPVNRRPASADFSSATR